MACAWLFSILCFGFAAAAALWAASLPRPVTASNFIAMIEASFVLLQSAARRYAFCARLSPIPVFSLSTSAATAFSILLLTECGMPRVNFLKKLTLARAGDVNK